MCSVILAGGHLADFISTHELDHMIIVVLQLDQLLIFQQFLFHFPHLFL